MFFGNPGGGGSLTAIDKVRKRIVYMTYDIIVFFYRCLCNIVDDFKHTYAGKFSYPGYFPYPEKFPYPGFLHEFLHVFIPGLPYPENFPYH